MNSHKAIDDSSILRTFPGKGIFIFCLAFLSLLAWSISTPVGGTPDEDFHLASIWCGQGIREGLCESGSNPAERLIPKDLVYSAVCFAFDPEQSASCQRDGFGTGSELIASERGNFTGLYPPVYYWTMSWFANGDINTSVFVMKVVNTLLFLSTLSMVVLLIKQKNKLTPIKVALFTLIPLGVFLIPSINPSSWAITACIGVYFATSMWLQREGQAKYLSLLMVAVMTLMGAGSRADAAIFVFIAITAAFVMYASKIQLKSLKNYIPLFLAIIITIIMVLPSGQASVGNNGLEGDEQSSLTGLTLLVANFIQTPELWAGVFGYWGLGWLDTPMPAVVWVLGTLMFGYLYFSGLQYSAKRKKITLIALLLLLWFIPVVILFKSGLTVGAGVQPRYLLPLIVITGIVALDRRKIINNFTFSRLQMNLFYLFIFMNYTVALFINFRRYESGIDVMSPNLWVQNEWAWPSGPPPMVSWIIGCASFAAVLLLCSKSTGNKFNRVCATQLAQG